MSGPEALPVKSPPTTQRIHRHGVDGLSACSKDQQQRYAHDIQWNVIGPMPTHEFLDEFFPKSPESPDLEAELKQHQIDYDKTWFASVPDMPAKEEDIYKGLCDELDLIAEARGFIFADTSRRVEDPGVVGTVKPDICLFTLHDQNQGHFTANFKKHEEGRGGEYFYFPHMGLVYLFIEVKKDASQDIFTDPPEGPLPPDYRFTVDTWSQEEDLQARISALGQNAHYAHVILTRQFRIRTFSLSISGTTARIMCWERSGVLVTEAFDYKANPWILIDFVWRFVKATKLQQGFDPTAVPVDSKEDRHSFLAAIRSHAQLQLDLDPETDKEDLDRAVEGHCYRGAITRLTIENYDIWVSRPIWVAPSVLGRCTAGYWGVRCDTKDVTFVKSIWRTNVEGVEQEGDILKHLKGKGVRHIPTVLCHGDVTSQGVTLTTRLDKFVQKPWVKSLHPRDSRLRKVLPRVPYRLVTDIAGYPLSTFRGSRELLKATYDGFTTLKDAHDKADTLHRDMSLGNIILARLKEKAERIGHLIDWELYCERGKVMPRDHVLTGTPAFMSYRALIGQGHMHSLKDDLESFIYVVLYAALRWLPVDSPQTLRWWMTDFFSAPQPSGADGGSDRKLVNAVSRRYTEKLQSTKSPHVVLWLNKATALHYKDGLPNHLWNDGEELKKMWEEILAQDLPSDDRIENQIEGVKTREGVPYHATFTSTTSTQDLYRSRNDPIYSPPPTPSKRPLAQSVDDSVPPPVQNPSKRSRMETRAMSVGNRGDDDLMTGVDSAAMSLGGTSAPSSEGHTASSTL